MQLTDKQEQKVIKILRALPLKKANELLAFAEHLKTKNRAAKNHQQRDLPTFHIGRIEKNAFDRDTLYGI